MLFGNQDPDGSWLTFGEGFFTMPSCGAAGPQQTVLVLFRILPCSRVLEQGHHKRKEQPTKWDKELLLWWLSRGFRHAHVPIYWFTRGLFCFEAYLSFCCCWEFLQAYDMFRSNLLSFPPLHFSPVSFTFTSQLHDLSLSLKVIDLVHSVLSACASL